MMKNKLLIIVAAFALIASSCSDWLDVRPGTEQTADQLFESYQGYKDAIIGCYIKMNQRSLYGENLTITTIEYLAQHWDLNTYARYISAETVDALKQWDYQDDNARDVIESIYAGLYNVIIQANDILKALPLTGETAIEDSGARAVVEGEALAIRAFCHFDALRLFGQVPGGIRQVSLPYSEDVSKDPVAYYSYNDFIAKIEADLLRAEILLEEGDPLLRYSLSAINTEERYPDDNYSDDEFLQFRQLRLNYWAVKALQARFYLYTGQASKAYTAAMAVIGAANPDGTTMFPLQRLGSTTTYFGLPAECVFMFNTKTLPDYVEELVNRDGAFYGLYMSSTKLSDAEMFNGAVSTSTDTRYVFGWDNTVRDNYWQMRPLLMKYDQTDQPTGDVDKMIRKQIIPALRVSEQYLIAMETSNDLSEINRLYEAYNYARDLPAPAFTNKSEVLDMVLQEYRRDLFAEGQMFYTYKRTGAGRMLWTTPASLSVTEDAYIVPLPQTEYDPNL